MHGDQRRLYSAEASSVSAGDTTTEPPDYLSESELDIFKTIKAQLEPVSLEVYLLNNNMALAEGESQD